MSAPDDKNELRKLHELTLSSEVHERRIFIEDYLRPASVEDYRAWLEGWTKRFVEGGGDVDKIRAYNHPLYPSGLMFVARKDIPVVPKFSGSSRMDIIIPEGIKAPRLSGIMPYGETELFFMEEFESYGTVETPAIYSDI